MAEIPTLHGGSVDSVYDNDLVDVTCHRHSPVHHDECRHRLDLPLDSTESQSSAKDQDHCVVLLAVLIDLWDEIPYRGRRFITASPKVAA